MDKRIEDAYTSIWVNVLSMVHGDVCACVCVQHITPKSWHNDASVCCVHYTHLRSSDPIDSISSGFIYLTSEKKNREKEDNDENEKKTLALNWPLTRILKA